MIKPISERFEYFVKPDYVTGVSPRDRSPGAALLITFDVKDDTVSTPLASGQSLAVGSLEWRLTLWRDSSSQLCAEERFPFQGGSTSRLSGRALLEKTVLGLSLLAPRAASPEEVVVLLQAVYTATGGIYASASRALRLQARSAQQPSSEPSVQLCAGQTAHCTDFLKASSTISVDMSISYAMLPRGRPLSALQCRQRRLLLLRPPFPPRCAQLLALASPGHSLLPVDFGRPAAAAMHLPQQFPLVFESAAVSIQDLRLAQDLHDCYHGDSLLVSACFAPADPREPRGAAALLGSLSSSSGEYYSAVHIPSPATSPATHGLRNDRGRFLLVFVSAPSHSAQPGVWEVCAGVVDLHSLQHKGDLDHLEEGASHNVGPVLAGCISVDGTVDVVLKAAPVLARFSAAGACSHGLGELPDNSSSAVAELGNLSAGAVAVGTMTLRLQVTRLLHDGFQSDGRRTGCVQPYPFASLELRPFPPRPSPTRLWSWDGTRLSVKMSLAIDALIAAPSTIASYFRFDVGSVPSSLEIDPGAGWHTALLEPSTCADVEEGAECTVHFNELSLQEKCILLSLMAEILDHFPDMSNFLARLSVEPVAPSEIEGGGGAHELFAFFLPVVRQVLAKDLGPARLLGDCELLPFPLQPDEVLVEVLDQLRCMPVLISYVESWLQLNDFAELIADPCFSTVCSSRMSTKEMDSDTDTEKENCDTLPSPAKYSLAHELSRPEDSWDSLISVCWCMSAMCADPHGEALSFYRWHNEAAVSAEAVSSHVLVSLLLYGTTLLFDAAGELATVTVADMTTGAASSSRRAMAKLTQKFINKVLFCVNMLVSKVLAKYSYRHALRQSAPTSEDEDCHEMSCQLFVALARFGDSLTAISETLPEVMGSDNWHACSTMAVNVFSSSQFCRVDTSAELMEVEIVCLRSLMRCLSAVAARSDRRGPGAASLLRVADATDVDNASTDTLSHLSTLLGGRIAVTLREVPMTVTRKRPPASPPPRARGKKKSTVANLPLTRDPATSPGVSSITSMRSPTCSTNMSGADKGGGSPAFGPDKGWFDFGLSDTMTLTETEYKECCSRVRSLDSLAPEHESGFEVDEAGVMTAVIRALGLWAAVLRDLVSLIDSKGCAFRRASGSVGEPVTKPQTAQNTTPTRSTIFSGMRSKRNGALPRSSRGSKSSDNSPASRESDGGHAGRELGHRQRALYPLHQAVSVLWETLLGDPVTRFELDGAEAAGLRAFLSLSTAAAPPPAATATSTSPLAFRELAYISVKVHEWLFSLRDTAAATDVANSRLAERSSSDSSRRAPSMCPCPIGGCSGEELLMMDLNSILHLLVDVSACYYKATLDFALAKGHSQQGESPNTSHTSVRLSMKQDIESLLLTANCLYLQVSLNPLLAEKLVTGHVLASLGLMPPPRRSTALTCDSIEEWSKLWYNINVVGVAMLLTALDRLRRQEAAVQETSCHIAALLQLLEKQCSLDHLIGSRPDVVAACMHRWAPSSLALFLEAATFVPRSESEGADCGSRKQSVSAEDAFTTLWTAFVSRPDATTTASPRRFADATPQILVNASSSAEDILERSVVMLLRCCTSLLSNCAFLSSSAFSLPVSAGSAVSGGSGKQKKLKNRLGKSPNQAASRAYLSSSFVTSVMGVIPQFVRAQIYASMSSLRELKAIAPLLSPATNMFSPRPKGRPSTALGPLFRSLKRALSDGKLPQRHHLGGDMEVMYVMGTAEAQLHLVLYDVSCLLSGWTGGISGSAVNGASDGFHHREMTTGQCWNKERKGFHQLWMAAATDALLRLRPFPWQRDVGTVTRQDAIEWSQAAEDTAKHVHLLESTLSVGAPSLPENSELATRSVLCDLYGSAWRVAVSYLKLLEFDINMRQALRPVLAGAYLHADENSSAASRLREESEEAANAFERRHQLARDVLKWLLRCGNWEAGRSLCQVLLEGYQRALRSPHTATPAPLLKAAPTLLQPSNIIFSVVSTIRSKTSPTQTQQSPFPAFMRACDLDFLQQRALGSERLQTLCRELARATDTFDDRLLHDGAARCLPVHYAVRFMCSPWPRGCSGPIGTSGEAPQEDALRELAASCGCSFVCVLPTPLPVDKREEDHAGSLYADLDAAVGIREQEIWLLLKYDCAAFSWNEEDDEAGGGGGLATWRYLELLKSRGGPLGSYSRLVHQVARAFPDFCLKSSNTLHALDRAHPCSAAADGRDATSFPKVVQIFEAFPNLADPASAPSEQGVPHHVHPRENVTIFANDECHSSAFAGAVLAGVGEERGVDRKDALTNHLSATVHRSSLLFPQCATFSTFPPQGASNSRAPLCTDPPVPAFSAPHHSAGTVLSQWQQHADCSTFLVHTCLHPSRCPSDRPSDPYFTTTLVLSAASASDGGQKTDSAPFESGKGLLNVDDCSLLTNSRVLEGAPAQLAVVSSAVVLPSMVTQGFCVLRSHLLRLKHCESLLVHLQDTAADALKRSDDVSSFSTIVKYVVACVSNCVARPEHERNDSSKTIMGIHNAAAMICGEVERRDLLWQRARRTIKHDHVSRKAAFDQWVKDAKAGGQPGRAPPPCPSDLDVATLEQAFVSSLQAVDGLHLATLLGVSPRNLSGRLEAAAAALLDPVNCTQPSPSQGLGERSVEARLDCSGAGRTPQCSDYVTSSPMSVLHLVSLLQQQTIVATQRVLVLLRKCVEFLPDTDSTPLPRRDTSQTESTVSTESEGGNVDMTSRGDEEDKPSGSTRQGWLQIVRWLEHSFLSRNV